MLDAQAIRDKVDAAHVAALLDRAPSFDSFVFSHTPEAFANWALCEGIKQWPADPAKRIETVRRLEAQVDVQLASARSRYEKIRAEGIAALSDYDLVIASGGDPYGALSTALLLTRNHCRYYGGIRAALHVMREHAEAETNRQGSLF
ncbi:TPA: hypothetical protein ACK3Q6_004477 [Burkholderia cepacia]